MNNITHHQHTQRNRFSVAVLFVLAVLLLGVSCPVKRLLQINASTPTSSSATKSVQTAVRFHQIADPVVACGSVSEQAVVVITKQDLKLPSASEVPSLAQASGCSIYQYLSGTEKAHHASPSLIISSLPLFLQQQRLLI